MHITAVNILVVVTAVTCWLYARWRRSNLSKGSLPVPGPKGFPVIGSTLPEQPHRQLIQWAQQYGEIYRVRLGWNNWYMLNSPEAVKEIMDRQSAHTSSRVPMPVANDVLSGGMRFLLMPYGPSWRTLRSVSHKLLTPKMSNTFQPSQEFEAKQLVHDMLTDNVKHTQFYMHVRRYTVSVMMTSTYGVRIPQWVSVFHCAGSMERDGCCKGLDSSLS